MGTRENKELIRRLFEVGFSKEPDRIDQFFTPAYVDHTLFKNLAGLKSGIKAFHAAFQNVSWKIEDMIAEGEKVAVRSEMKIPSGLGPARSIRTTAFYRFENGKIAETWGNTDPV
jgi:predicted ester cyclase